MRCRVVLATLVAAAVSVTTVPPGAALIPATLAVRPLDRYATDIDIETTLPIEVEVAGTGDGATTTNDFPEIRETGFVAIPFGGVTSPRGGVLAIEHLLRHTDVAGGKGYLPCKAAPTSLPNYEFGGGEPYKAACENASKPSYLRSGPFTGGARQLSATFPNGLRIANETQTQACVTTCEHGWANRTVAIGVEIYLKKPRASGGTETDFDYVRPRFTASGFEHAANGGHYSRNVGVIRPLKAYEPGASRIQGYIYEAGNTYLDTPNRLVFSVFANDATGRTSTGMPLQAFSAFSNRGGYYTTGVMYTGYYKFKIRDTVTGTCVMNRNMAIRRMGERVDIRLDRPAFGIPGARVVPC